MISSFLAGLGWCLIGISAVEFVNEVKWYLDLPGFHEKLIAFHEENKKQWGNRR